jgi:hypothetical protein
MNQHICFCIKHISIYVCRQRNKTNAAKMPVQDKTMKKDQTQTSNVAITANQKPPVANNNKNQQNQPRQQPAQQQNDKKQKFANSNGKMGQNKFMNSNNNNNKRYANNADNQQAMKIYNNNNNTFSHHHNSNDNFNALANEKKTDKKFTGRCRLFVGNLPGDVSETEFRGLFTKYGEVGEAYLHPTSSFGFVKLVSFFFFC